MRKGGEDQRVVVDDFGEVGEIRLGQDIVRHAGHRRLVLRRHKQL
jgi:hypothetical protein